jgi:hypothetical protein
MMNKPYTIFNETKSIPVKVYYQSTYQPEMTEWDAELWVERGEDWYALLSPQLRDKRVRVIERDIWLKV